MIFILMNKTNSRWYKRITILYVFQGNLIRLIFVDFTRIWRVVCREWHEQYFNRRYYICATQICIELWICVIWLNICHNSAWNKVLHENRCDYNRECCLKDIHITSKDWIEHLCLSLSFSHTNLDAHESIVFILRWHYFLPFSVSQTHFQNWCLFTFWFFISSFYNGFNNSKC